MTDRAPPAWAECVLRLQLAPRDRDPVSGDLLEMYRDRLDAAAGQRRTARRHADAWYVGQVVRIAARACGPWVAAFALVTLARTGVDWLRPVADFAARSRWTTAVSVLMLFVVGFTAAWRRRSVAAALAAGLLTSVGGGLLHALGALALLAARHDVATIAAVRASGGLGEALTLPFCVALPGALIAALGGAAGRLVGVATTRAAE